MPPTALAMKVALSPGLTRGAMPATVPAKAARHRILKTLPAEVATSTQSNATLVRRCGKRHRTAPRAGAGARVRLMGATAPSAVDQTKAGSSAVVPENAKELTVVGRRAEASQKGSLRLRASAMGNGEAGAVVPLRKRKMMKLRSNHGTRLIRTNSMAAMLKANSRVASLDRGNVPGHDMVVMLVADARSVTKRANDFRRSSRAPVLARVAKSKSGFALDESLSTASLRSSVFALGRRITCASMDA
jgi:hypothetical protein